MKMAHRYATDKEVDKKFEKSMNIAKKWFAKGFNTEQIASGLWNKIGYTCEAASDNSIKVRRQYNGKGQKPYIVEVILSE
jgi:hypothetical protein